MLAQFSNRPVLQNKGFFQKAAERATQNYLNSQEEIEPTLEEQTEDTITEQRKSFFSEASSRIGEALGNYATGAVQGAQEVARQANRLSVSNPLALTGTPMQEGYTNSPAPVQSDEQKKSRELYKSATGNFTEETIAPAAMTTALLAPSSLAGPIFSPFVLNSLQENVKNNGAKGVVDTVTEFVPGAGAYHFSQQEGVGQYAKERPGAFAVDAIASLVPDVIGVRIGGRAVNKTVPNYRLATSSLLGNAEKSAANAASKILHNIYDNPKDRKQAGKSNDILTEGLQDTRKVQGMLSENQSLPEVKLTIDEQSFAKRVDTLVSGERGDTELIKVLTTPLALELVGAEMLPIEITSKNLKKMTVGKHNFEKGIKGEGMSPEIVKQIPRALSDPLMIFEAPYKGKNGERRIVTVLNLKDENGVTVIAPFELKKINNKKGYEINELLSAYGKTEKRSGRQYLDWYEKNVENGSLRYINKERTAEWLLSARDEDSSARNEYPMLERAINSSLSINIPTEKEFVNLKKRKTEQYSLKSKSGEQTSFGDSGKTVAGQDVKPVTRKEVEAAFDAIVPVRVGGVDKKYEGLFKVAPEVVRSRVFADYSTYAHEVGHFIDKKLKIKGSDGELIYGAEKVWGDNNTFKSYNNAEKRAEGIAEFTRQVLSDPVMAERNFPKYYKNFIHTLADPAHKDLAAKFDALADVLHRYSLQSDQARARAAVSYTDDPSTKSFVQKRKENFQKAYDLMVDDKTPIDRFVQKIIDLTGKEMDYNDNPYLLARSVTSSAKARAAMLLEDKGTPLDVIDSLNKVYNNKLKHAVTLQQILKEAESVKFSKEYLASNGYKDNRQAFSAYLVAKRQIELQKIHKNYKGPMESEVAQAVVDSAPREFASASEKVYQHFDNVLSILEDGGIISEEYHKILNEKYKNYVPMYRDKTVVEGADIPGFKPKKGLANVSDPVKGINEHGSNRNVIDPIDSLIRQTETAIEAAERNKVARAVISKKDIEGIGRYLEERADLEGVGKPEDYVFTVWENGEKKSYKTTPELYEAMTNLSAPVFEQWVKPLMAPADILRTGATGTPAFGVTNFFRDLITTVLFSDNTTIPVVEPVVNIMYGLYQSGKANFLGKKSSVYREFEVSGVPMTTRMSVERSSLKWQRIKESPGVKQGAWIIDQFQKFNQTIEEGGRLGEFAAARRKGKSIGEAGHSAKEVTVDFGRGGTAGRSVNKLIPFFNAAIQGTDRLAREIKAHPFRLATRLTTAVVLPTIVEWLSFHDEEWYRDVPQDIRDNYLLMRVGDNVVKIPFPQDVAPLSAGLKRVLNKMYGDNPEPMDSWARNTLDLMLPDFTPAFVKPALEWQAEYNFFTGKSTIPASLQNLPDKEQKDIYSSMTSIKLGEVFDVSPKKIDNLIGSVGGTGAVFMNEVIGDTLLGRNEVLPEKNISEMPVVGRLNYTPGKRSQNVEDFYQLYETTSKQYNAYGKLGENVEHWPRLKESMKKVRALNKRRKAVLNDKNLTARQKRDLMDKDQEQIIKIATFANKNYRGAK